MKYLPERGIIDYQTGYEDKLQHMIIIIFENIYFGRCYNLLCCMLQINAVSVST